MFHLMLFDVSFLQLLFLWMKPRFLSLATSKLTTVSGKWWSGNSKMKASQAYTWSFGLAESLMQFVVLFVMLLQCGSSRSRVPAPEQKSNSIEVCEVLHLRTMRGIEVLDGDLAGFLDEIATRLIHRESW